MPYKFVQWSKNASVNGDKLNAMCENDEYLIEQAKKLPQGVLAYARSTSDFNYDTLAFRSSIAITTVPTSTFYIPETRIIRFTIFGGLMGIDPGADNGRVFLTLTGTSGNTYDNPVSVEYSVYSASYPGTYGHVKAGYEDVILPEDTYTATLRYTNLTNSGDYPFFRKYLTYMIEDRGSPIV